ncbi:hypothetical protein FRB94_012102 [Tulasnella sp. JGI-2019a]|nr:hypothetical protein FRB94_012102 [Tulasnella sp. JGI-2019a]
MYLNATRTLRTTLTIPAVRYRSNVSQTTSASSSKNPFPFPPHRNPTPLQIFHLDSSASDADIKSRYYELVKLFHPDTAAQDGASSKVRQDRFQRITVAYNQLRRKNGRSKLPSVSDIYRASGSGAQANRTWTGKRNEWGGFEYQYDDHFREKGQETAGATAGSKPRYERTFHESDAPYWIFFAVAFVGGIVQFIFFSPAQEAARHNRKATQSLNDARQSREEHGAKRREELKLWAEQQRRRKEEELGETEDDRLAQVEGEMPDAAAPAKKGAVEASS